MADTGFLIAGTGAHIPASNADWFDPTNIEADDTNVATATVTTKNFTDYLAADNFGFSLPANSIINGVEVVVDRGAASTGATTSEAQLVIAGTISGDDLSGEAWPAVDEDTTYGGPTEKWGLSLTEADIENEDFGFVIRASLLSGSILLHVQLVSMKVYYTPPPTDGVKLNETVTVTKGVSTSWTLPGTGATSAHVDSNPWTTPNNVTVDDNTNVATCAVGLNEETDYLIADNYGFSLPADATILGIEVRVDRAHNDVAAMLDSNIELLKAGVQTGQNKASGVYWPGLSTLAKKIYGSPTDLWQASWTKADIEDEDFGSRVVGIDDAGGAGTATVDTIEMRIWYSAPDNPAPTKQIFITRTRILDITS
jgi:hypothetical protein